jgi:hypothetical protein
MRKRTRRRTPVPVDDAIRLYGQLRSWERVRHVLVRLDGSKFTYNGLVNAVRWRDRGNAGFRIG